MPVIESRDTGCVQRAGRRARSGEIPVAANKRAQRQISRWVARRSRRLALEQTPPALLGAATAPRRARGLELVETGMSPFPVRTCAHAPVSRDQWLGLVLLMPKRALCGAFRPSPARAAALRGPLQASCAPATLGLVSVKRPKPGKDAQRTRHGWSHPFTSTRGIPLSRSRAPRAPAAASDI